MSTKEKMKVLDDVLLGSFITSMQDEDLTKVSLIVNISPAWLQVMKRLCTEVDNDFASIVESILHKFYQAGLNAVNADLRKRYKTPRDLLETYLATK